MKQPFTALKQSQGFKQSLLTIFGNNFAITFSALALMMISRLLGPKNFGEFSVGFALVMIISKINDLGLSTALIKYAGETTNKESINKFFSITLKLRFILSIILSLTGLFSVSILNHWLKLETPMILILSFTFGLSTVYYEQLSTMLLAVHRFTQTVLINLIQALVKFFTVIYFFLAQLNLTTSIFFIYITAPIIPIFLAKQLLPNWIKIKLKPQYITEKKLILSMMGHTAFTSLATCLTENIGILFVQAYLNTYETGLLGGTSRIAMLFSSMAASLGQVLFPRVARYKSADNLSRYTKKAYLMLIVTGLAFLTLLPFSKWAIILTIGEEYLPGLNILILLLAAAFLTIATIPFMAFFYSFDAHWYFSFTGIVQLLIVIIGNLYFVPKYGLKASAIVSLVSRFIIFVFTVISGLLILKQKTKTS